MPTRRTVFFISDRTGITAEMLGNSLLSQFDEIEFHRLTIPFVDSPEKVDAAIEQVNEIALRDGRQAHRVQLDRRREDERDDPAQHECADARSLPGLHRPARGGARGKELARGRALARASPTATSTTRGWRRSTSRRPTTTAPRRAISPRREVILVGVSRCGKTPTSLYLALQFGIRAANFPLTPDDFADRALPASVVPHKERLFGLTINPERLHKIREERRPGSKYASLENCRYEVKECEHLLERERIPMLDTTAKSIEEIATTISYRAKLRRHMY